MNSLARRRVDPAAPARLEIVAYAPTEFFHCQHCEVAWQGIGLGAKIREEQRASGQLPPDLQAEYQAISDWVADARDRYGERLQVTLVDAASIEGFFKALWRRRHKFPAIFIDGHAVAGFDARQLDDALEARLGPSPETFLDPDPSAKTGVRWSA